MAGWTWANAGAPRGGPAAVAGRPADVSWRWAAGGAACVSGGGVGGWRPGAWGGEAAAARRGACPAGGRRCADPPSPSPMPRGGGLRPALAGGLYMAGAKPPGLQPRPGRARRTDDGPATALPAAALDLASLDPTADTPGRAPPRALVRGEVFCDALLEEGSPFLGSSPFFGKEAPAVLTGALRADGAPAPPSLPPVFFLAFRQHRQ